MRNRDLRGRSFPCVANPPTCGRAEPRPSRRWQYAQVALASTPLVFSLKTCPCCAITGSSRSRSSEQGHRVVVGRVPTGIHTTPCADRRPSRGVAFLAPQEEPSPANPNANAFAERGCVPSESTGSTASSSSAAATSSTYSVSTAATRRPQATPSSPISHHLTVGSPAAPHHDASQPLPSRPPGRTHPRIRGRLSLRTLRDTRRLSQTHPHLQRTHRTV